MHLEKLGEGTESILARVGVLSCALPPLLAFGLGRIHEYVTLTGLKRWRERFSPNDSSLNARPSASWPNDLVLS
jgi:hypothetical protein